MTIGELINKLEAIKRNELTVGVLDSKEGFKRIEDIGHYLSHLGERVHIILKEVENE